MLWAGAALGAGASIASGAASMYFQHLENKKAWHRQKKVLQKQIQWRVDDARKAGIHPLAALGISPASGPAMAGVGDLGGDSAAAALSNAGQAYAAGQQTKEEKILGQLAIEESQIRNENLKLDGQLKQRELNTGLSTGLTGRTGDRLVDALQGDGQVTAGEAVGVEMVPKQVTSARATGAGGIIESGVEPFEKLKMTWDGFLYVMPSDPNDLDQNAALKGIYYASYGNNWAIRAIMRDPAKYCSILPPLDKGMVWRFDRKRGQFQAMYGKSNYSVGNIRTGRTVYLQMPTGQEEPGPSFVTGP